MMGGQKKHQAAAGSTEFLHHQAAVPDRRVKGRAQRHAADRRRQEIAESLFADGSCQPMLIGMLL
jgi:hypothetical protein